MSIISIIIANKAIILGALLACSEVLGLIPSVKSNSLFESIVGVLQKFIPAKEA